MGYDLSNRFGESFRFQIWSFGSVLDLTVANGWKPAGTLPPFHFRDEDEWAGAYTSNDGQIITDGDALALGEAIERAIPNFLQSIDKPELWSYRGPDATTLRSFTFFCRSGGFKIS